MSGATSLPTADAATAHTYDAVVRHAVTEVLPAPAQIAALQVWSTEFGRQARPSLREVAQRLSAAVGQPSGENSLYAALLRNLLRFKPSLPAGPALALNHAVAARAAAPSVRPDAGQPAELAVFVAVMRAFLAQLPRSGSGDPGLVLKGALEAVVADAGLRLALRQCILQGEAASLRLPLQAARAILHRFYIDACKAYGPVEADRALAGAVAGTRGLPQAAAFAPEELL